MTYDSRGHAVESADITEQRHENTMLNARNSESNQSATEQLIENFPEAKLRSLIAKISSPRWVVPVLPEQELECLLNYAIELTKAGVDEECELCMRFYREGLTVSFMKILTDEAVNSWKYNIHYCIFNSCAKFMQLCALHLKRDNSYILELLSVVLDPDNKFNTFNISRQATIPYVASLAANAVKNENSSGGQTTTTSSTTTAATTNSIKLPAVPSTAVATTTITPLIATTSATASTTANTTQSTTTTTAPVSQTQNEDTSTTQSNLSAPVVVTSKTSTSPVNAGTGTVTGSSAGSATGTETTTTNTTTTAATTAAPAVTTTVTRRQLPQIHPREHNENAIRNQLNNAWSALSEDQIFAKSPPEPHHPRGWLVDLINRFGQFGGFDNLLERFYVGVAAVQKKADEKSADTKSDANAKSAISNGVTTTANNTSTANATTTATTTSSRSSGKTSESNSNVTLHLIYALVRPFGQCYELLTVRTIEKYFLPMWEIVLQLLNNLSDDELKREAKPEGRNDLINGIIKAARCLTSRLSNQENLIKELEMFRLKMILRLLKISSFNGKMSALNEINKILFTFSYYPRQSQISMCPPEDEIDWLSAEKIAKWIKDSNVLGIVLHDSLHQPQYVDKLEKILRFLIKEKALTLSDLDAVWQAQAGKHEAIVKNVHDLLAKLAYDFNTEQLDHLFGCFQASMKSANKHQRERLLELIRRLAEDDKSGVMAHKVLKLFWTLAHSLEMPKEVMEQALTAHVKILDYSCAQERDAQKTIWLAKCVDELKQDNGWVLPALRLIREICCLYDPSTSHVQRMHQSFNRQHVIERLQNEHTLVILVTNSLTTYMDRVRAIVKESPETVPETLMLDQRYPHQQQIQERLEFLKFVLKDGQLWLCSDQAKQIWQCLAVNAAFTSDREECFRWFGKLMGEEPDLDPGINKDFFENNILQLDPQLLTESGIRCFERFFKAVNSKEEKLKAKSRSYILDDEDLIGKDYLWRVITTGNEVISHKAIQLLKEVSTALGPRLQANIASFHENFIRECCDRLKAYYDNIAVLTETMQSGVDGGNVGGGGDENIQENSDECKDNKMRHAEAEKMCRVIIMLLEYIMECDRAFMGERNCLPLSRAYRGKQVTLYIRIQFPGRQQTEDIEMLTHSNEMVSSFKRQLLKRIKSTPNNIKIEFFYANDNLIEINDDQNAISYYNIRDKMLLTAKLSPYNPGLSSSPDSSSDSSTGSPPRPCPDMMKPENERQLPGVIISQKSEYTAFFLRLYQLGIDLNHALLREGCRSLLHLLPIDRLTSQKLQQMCNPLATYDNLVVVTPESMFLHQPFAQVIYNLEVLYALLIPAIEHSQSFQLSWIHSGVAHFILELLTKNNFLPNSDVHTKRAAFTNVLRLSKIFLFVVGCVLSKVGDEPSPTASETGRSQIELLKSTFTNILGQTEQTIRTIAMKLADSLSNEMLSYEPEGERCRKLFLSALKWSCPDVQTIKAIVQLAWASGCGHLDMLDSSNNSFSNSKATPDQADHNLCKEALEVLTISLVLNPEASESLSKDPMWSKFILALVLENPMRQIRQSATEQLYLICTYCASDWRPFSFVITLLIDALENMAPHHATTCAEFFQLLCRTLNYGCMYNWPFPINDVLLTQEISWLRAILENVKQSGDTSVHEDLLEGHLCLTKELMFYFNADLKSQLTDFIMEILDEFLFPASRQYLQLHNSDHLINFDAAPPVCRSPHTVTAACDLLIALCQNSIPNMKLIVNNLVNMICSHSDPLREWEYLPPINARPFKGFCGLKNAGATCYMNSVLQQLFMVPSIRVGILSATGACNDPNEDFSNESESPPDYYRVENDGEFNNMSVRDRYNVSILKHVQAIFAHLGHSALQFYVPRGLWSQFKLQGEPVNLREQQDAVEFFMSILDSLDEGLKALGHPQLMASTLGGCFSDQKICKECPHRYSKEEPFSVFSVDIRNHSSLTESLEQYVKGELLEGADAYHCDKCNKKVVTIKRLCVRKLPPVLAIQLKRFEYDYERDCAIKFNDYFEFPRELDMEPYTVSGLAKMEGEVIEYEDEFDESQCITKYQLTGIVVHSGQASGGHYFSYILHKDYETGKDQWYKFDDGEVTECKMHEDEELKAQCFGGDYMGEVFDSNLKRMQFRRQKRWWNAYMLFYTRCDQKFIHKKSLKEQLSLAESRHCILPMPEPIERSVRIQNIRFLHSRSIFTSEFFNFIRKLVHSASPTRIDKVSSQAEELSLLGIQLAASFLFHTGFHTKKTLRGASTDWYETLSLHLRHSSMVRRWFAESALLNVPGRLAEYILVAPTPELRNMFVKLIVFLCHFAMNDEPLQSIQTTAESLCEQILLHVLYLLKSDVPDNGKHLTQYFTLFNMFASMNAQQKQQLLKLNVPAIFMQVALDEGPGPPIKHQYPELCKLHHVVSLLVRCSDITSECSSPNESPILPNIYGDPQIAPEDRPKLSKDAMQYLFQKTSYVKKVIEDVHVGEEGLKLLQYCCWENPVFSRNVLVELLWQCGFTYWHDLRHHTDMLLNILVMEDSWQNHRIHNALLGVAEEREGLLEIIQRTKTHYQKRAYQIMKCLVQLFKTCPCAHDMLLTNFKVTTQWVMACEWLREELERRVPSNQYSYSSWSHSTVVSSAATNDNSNGYMLERSQSAKNLLTLAFELCPSELDSTENEEISDGVLVRLQSQQMLDQIHGDEPLQSSGTGPVDGDNDSSDSATEDPRQLEESEWENKLEKIRLMGRVENNTRSVKKLGDDGYQNPDTVPNADESESRRSPYEDDGDEQEDDNDTNVTDDEENGGDKTMENYYYQIINIDEIGSTDKTAANPGQLQKMLTGTQEMTNDMKKLLINKSNAIEAQQSSSTTITPVSSSSDATVKSADAKPNAVVATTINSSSSPPAATTTTATAPVPSKTTKTDVAPTET